jgi:diketogulonate reductase-like aldo/keto reductase
MAQYIKDSFSKATFNHADKCADSLNMSLENLKTSYIDLVFIHWPGVKGLKLDDNQNSVMRKETWKVLEKFHSDGKIKYIGVSNYNLRHLNELMSYCSIRPHFLQVFKINKLVYYDFIIILFY